MGAESTYFVCDTSTREFKTNIDCIDFAPWIGSVDYYGDDDTALKYYTALETTTTLKRGYVPHSLAMGPNDMFCWIGESDYMTSKNFKAAFPAVERYLAYAKTRKILEQVVSRRAVELLIQIRS
jgi:hypothetical protein